MTPTFDELIAGVCGHIRCDDPQRLVRERVIFLNDVMFSFVHDCADGPQQFHLFASFGELPYDNQAKIIEKLLQENHAGFQGNGPGFCISPTTGKVVYALRYQLDRITPFQLASVMAHLARKALEWRATWFLDTPRSASRRHHFLRRSA